MSSIFAICSRFTDKTATDEFESNNEGTSSNKPKSVEHIKEQTGEMDEQSRENFNKKCTISDSIPEDEEFEPASNTHLDGTYVWRINLFKRY